MKYNYQDLEKYEIFNNKDLTYCMDYLTGVLDRRNITLLIENKIKNKDSFIIAICDVDNFKNINDLYGHYAGDMSLKAIASVLVEKTKDIGVVGRFGGDEFLIVINKIEDYDETWKILKSIHESIKMIKYEESFVPITLTLTTGCAKYPIDANTYEELFIKADKALYRGKQKGRNCFIIYNDELHKNINTSHTAPIIVARELTIRAIDIMNENISCDDKINKLLEEVSKEFNLDHLCINGLDKIENEYKKPKNVNEYQFIDNKLFGVFDEKNYHYTYNFSTLKEKAPELHQILFDQKVKAIAFFKLEYLGKFFGYLRIEDSTTKRVWQENEILSCLIISSYISIFKYYEK